MQSKFVLSPRYTNILESFSAARSWADELVQLPHNEKIENMRSTMLMIDFSRFWEIEPKSDAYRMLVTSFFETLRDAPYNISNEAVAGEMRDPANVYPYITRSENAVAENLIGIGGILKALPVSPPSRILEMGCGWANSSLTMARTGYKVTAIDIDPTCASIIEYWRKLLSLEDNLHFVQSAFENVSDSVAADQLYDAVVFYKSFHHSLYPIDLLKQCYNLLHPGGALLLAAEPIHGNYYVPWGIRCDGTSLFAIIKEGWMELGFDTEFFDAIANEIGFSLSHRNRSPEHPTYNYDLYTRQ